MASQAPNADDLISVGHISAPHGIRGWTWIHSLTEPSVNIFGYLPWYLKTKEGFKAVKVLEWNQQGKGVIARLDVCIDRTAAELWRNTEIWVPKSALPELPEGDYYWSDLMDLSVKTPSGQLLGQVETMMETGSNDVIVVRACEGSLDKQERLIPWLPGTVVKQVDLEAGVIVVDWDPEF